MRRGARVALDREGVVVRGVAEAPELTSRARPHEVGLRVPTVRFEDRIHERRGDFGLTELQARVREAPRGVGVPRAEGDGLLEIERGVRPVLVECVGAAALEPRARVVGACLEPGGQLVDPGVHVSVRRGRAGPGREREQGDQRDGTHVSSWTA